MAVDWTRREDWRHLLVWVLTRLGVNHGDTTGEEWRAVAGPPLTARLV